MENGHVRLFTGDGKGKTVMALGLAVRVAGQGRKVFVGQFIKDDPHGDILALRKAIPGVVTAQFGCGTGCICGREPDAKDRECARRGLERARQALTSGGFGLVVLDEITIPMYFGLISADEVRELLSLRAPICELVLTGRYAPEELKALCDMVTVVTSEKLPDPVPDI
ncbi:MAG TPA: cob(I)yrinic acid a,c-diamide adenosyltransferase [Oscillospiraceae bacterium]|nr:cob(I)yrinic acid a,c-diamide adenosyltransferase [Oscillospiraceae bacterium]HRW56595.1 cob(I)yrinic acid a,c-diamide adenosyltransferase [Oscillospiraceae bacterium]